MISSLLTTTPLRADFQHCAEAASLEPNHELQHVAVDISRRVRLHFPFQSMYSLLTTDFTTSLYGDDLISCNAESGARTKPTLSSPLMATQHLIPSVNASLWQQRRQH